MDKYHPLLDWESLSVRRAVIGSDECKDRNEEFELGLNVEEDTIKRARCWKNYKSSVGWIWHDRKIKKATSSKCPLDLEIQGSKYIQLSWRSGLKHLEKRVSPHVKRKLGPLWNTIINMMLVFDLLRWSLFFPRWLSQSSHDTWCSMFVDVGPNKYY